MMESKLEGGGVGNGLRKARSSDPKVDCGSYSACQRASLISSPSNSHPAPTILT